jgi:hypothetical protein
MRVAVIGNSHIGALKLAISSGLFKSNNLDFVFWGVAGQVFNTTSYESGYFRTSRRDVALTVSNGQYEALPAREFDAIVFHGPPVNLVRYLGSLRRSSIDIRLYSLASLQEGLQKWIDRIPTYQLVRSFRTDYDRRVLISPTPLKSEDCGEFDRISVAAEELALLNTCVSNIIAGIPADYIPQPPRTVRNHKYTKREYCLNAVRLANPSITYPENDPDHMNGRYGACVLQEIEASLLAGT